MRIAKKRRAATDVELESKHERELGTALVQALDLPLNALRASMEALAGELGENEMGRQLPFVLDEVGRLERNVRDLIAYTSPGEPIPLRCTLDEITQSACYGLPKVLRQRVLNARHDCGKGVFADGPMISRCLCRLIENAFEAGAQEVLLVSRRSAKGATFIVVDAAPEDLQSDWAIQAFHSKRSNQLGLGLPLVQRDVELMGGELQMTASSRGSTCIELHVPDEALPSNGKQALA